VLLAVNRGLMTPAAGTSEIKDICTATYTLCIIKNAPGSGMAREQWRLSEGHRLRGILNNQLQAGRRAALCPSTWTSSGVAEHHVTSQHLLDLLN